VRIEGLPGQTRVERANGPCAQLPCDSPKSIARAIQIHVFGAGVCLLNEAGKTLWRVCCSCVFIWTESWSMGTARKFFQGGGSGRHQACCGLNTSHVTLHTSHLTRQTSHLTPHTSHAKPHTLTTPHLTPHTSHLTPHTPHLTPHTSHLTPHTAPTPSINNPFLFETPHTSPTCKTQLSLH